MLKLFLILLVVFPVLSCGQDVCVGSDMRTAQGICVFSSGLDVDLEQLNQAINTTEKICKEVDKNCTQLNARQQYQDTSITFLNEEDMLERFDKYALVNSQTGILSDDYFEAFVTYKECLTTSALVHELLHVINISMYGFPEPGGFSPEAHPVGWFVHKSHTTEENDNSMETRIFENLWFSMCPK